MTSIVAISGSGLGFPTWGRAFWHDQNDGQLICLYASGNNEANFIASSDSGVTWSNPSFAFPVDDFSIHNNFDSCMDRVGHVHVVHRYNGSGCYSVLGKTVGSGWAPSGVVARGFFDCRATSAARDFNGQVEVYDTAHGGAFAVAGPTEPAAFITAVPSGDDVKFWYVDSPYTATPTLQGTVSSVNVGPSGGFPVLMNGAGALGGLAISFYIEGTGISFRQYFFGWGDNNNGWPTYVEIDPNANESGILRQQGFIADVPYTPNMAALRINEFGNTTTLDETYLILTSAADSGSFELYGTAQENGQISTGQWFGRIDSTAGSSGVVASGVGVRRLEPDNLTFKDFINGLAGSAPQITGVPVDMSYYDETIASEGGGPSEANIHMYFLQRKLNGDQTIFRIKAGVERSDAADSQTRTRVTLSSLDDVDFGIKEFGNVSLSVAGAGSNNNPNKIHWHGLKALRRAVSPDTQGYELVSVVGKGVNGGTPDTDSYIYMVRPDPTKPGTIPTYVSEYTTQSGTIFSGILSASSITNPQNLFDDNVNTSGLIDNGADITLAFDRVLSFNRVEILWNSPPDSFWGVDIESSYDDVTYENVFSLPSGTPGNSPSLIKLSAEYDPLDPDDPTVTSRMDGFAGQYVRLTFSGDDATSRDVREIKLYGANWTAGFTATSGWESEVVSSNAIEKFGTAATGLPSGWYTYGDWEWFIDTGTHESGIFTNNTIGSGDYSAARTARPSAPDTSGVLETSVELNPSETRVITFDVKYDFQSNLQGILSPTDPADDYLEFFVITPTGTIDKTDDILESSFFTPRNWRTITVELDTPGINILRWVYTRGNRKSGQAPAFQEAAAWIDNVNGLDPIQGSPNLLTSIWGFTSADPPLETSDINGYVYGAGPVSGVVNAYMDTVSGIPTEIINAYHAGEFMATGVVNAYTAATREFGDVYGYMEGFIDTPSEMCYGYMLNSGIFDILYGHMQAKLNESINGFMLAPSGAVSKINAYIITPQFLAINAYLKTTEENLVQINAYLKADGFGDQINGYMFASGLNTSSYGYIKADGATDFINGYMRSTQHQDIAGYIQGASPVSGVINSWMSGIAAISNSINAFMPAISGDISEEINGFIGGLEVPNENIHGYLVGFGGSGQCSFPVPTPPFVSSPTGNFFN